MPCCLSNLFPRALFCSRSLSHHSGYFYACFLKTSPLLCPPWFSPHLRWILTCLIYHSVSCLLFILVLGGHEHRSLFPHPVHHSPPSRWALPIENASRLSSVELSVASTTYDLSSEDLASVALDGLCPGFRPYEFSEHHPLRESPVVLPSPSSRE